MKMTILNSMTTRMKTRRWIAFSMETHSSSQRIWMKTQQQLPPGSSGVEFVDGFVTLEFEAYHGASASESMLYGSDDSDAEDDSYMDEIDRSSALGSNDEIARGMGSSSASDIKNLANGSMDSVLLGAAVPRSDIAMPADQQHQQQQQQQSTLSEAIQAIDELDRHQPSVIGELEEFGNTPEVGTRLDARLSLRLTYADAVGNETSGLIDAQPMDTFDQLLRRAVAVHAPEYIDVAPETFQMLAYMDDMRYGVVLDPNEQLATVLNYLGESASQISSRLQLQLKHKSSSSTPTPQQQPQQPQQHLQVPGTPTKASNDGDTENETPRPTPRSPDPREAVSKALWRISAPSGPPPSTIAAKRRSIFSSDDVSKLNQDISLVTAVDDSKLSTPVEASGSNGNAQLAAYSEEELSKPVAHTFKRNNITVPHTLPKSPQSPTFSQHRHQSSESTDTSIILSDDDWLVILHGWDSRLDYQAHHHPYDIAYINDKTGEPAYFHAPEEPKLLRDWDQFAELSRTVGGHLDSLGMDLDGMVANLTRRWA
ncbi:hypothetical protein GQ42DRAFT_35979 [Ramicandelaber brevisporus]|nr:hypothetical protein GQ42DRAFT_35979 [Ramicandelaber brevisporus]